MQAGTPGGDTTSTPKKMMSKSVRPRVPSDMIEPSKEISFGKTIRDMKGKPVPPPPGKSKGMMQAGGTKLYNKKGQYQASGEKKEDNGLMARLSRAGQALADLPGNIAERYRKGVDRERNRTLEARKKFADPNSVYNNPVGKTKTKPKSATKKDSSSTSGIKGVGRPANMGTTGETQAQRKQREAAERRGPSREEKQNTRQGANPSRTVGPAARQSPQSGSSSSSSSSASSSASSGGTSFSKAFGNARKAGKFTFKWNGKTYGTRLKNETYEQHRAAMKKADPASNVASTTPKLKTKEIENTMPEKKLQVSKPAAPSAPASKTSGTLPDRRAAKKTGKETRGNLKDQIKDARKQNRGQKAAKRQGKRVDRLQEKLKKIQSR